MASIPIDSFFLCLDALQPFHSRSILLRTADVVHELRSLLLVHLEVGQQSLSIISMGWTKLPLESSSGLNQTDRWVGGAGGMATRQADVEATGGQNAPVVVPPAVKSIAGSFGGVVEACCLQPIDVIKTRLQLDRVGKYSGIYNCGTTVIKEEGLRALWKGLTPFATHLTLKYALRMGTNAVFQGLLRNEDGTLSNGSRMMAGFGAGVTEALVIVTPFEVVKIRLQQQRGTSKETFKYKGPINCASVIIREEGLRGMWSGASPTVLRNGTNQMCMFWAKSSVDGWLWGKTDGDGKRLLPWQSMISGFTAGCIGPVATGPFDVVKTRLMAQTKSADGEVKYRGLLHALAKIPQEEGLRAMWKGLLPRLMRIPPGQAIVWAVSDQITSYAERKVQRTSN